MRALQLKRMLAERAPQAGKAKRQRLPALDDEQVSACQAYAAKHGRRWKSILNSVWMGCPPHDDGGILRALRNSHGPTWLQSYRLPHRSAGASSPDNGETQEPDDGEKAEQA